jgi:hypothetical protein
MYYIINAQSAIPMVPKCPSLPNRIINTIHDKCRFKPINEARAGKKRVETVILYEVSTNKNKSTEMTIKMNGRTFSLICKHLIPEESNSKSLGHDTTH